MRNRTLLVAMVMIAVAAVVLVTLNLMQRYGGKGIEQEQPTQQVQAPTAAPASEQFQAPQPAAPAPQAAPPAPQAQIEPILPAPAKPQPASPPPPEFPIKQHFSPTGQEAPTAPPSAPHAAQRAPEKTPAKAAEVKGGPPADAQAKPQAGAQAGKDETKADKSKTAPQDKAAQEKSARDKAVAQTAEKIVGKDNGAKAPAKSEAASGVISAIKPGGKADEFILTVVASGDPKVKYSLLDSPPRLSVDLLGAWKWSGSDTITTGNPLVKSVRVGHHPDRLRLVLDLAQGGLKHSVDDTDKGVFVKVSKGK